MPVNTCTLAARRSCQRRNEAVPGKRKAAGCDCSLRLLQQACSSNLSWGGLGRSISSKTGKSVLHGLQTTSLLSVQEKLAWWLTWLWLGNYYRTYLDRTVEPEVEDALAHPNKDFLPGPMALG